MHERRRFHTKSDTVDLDQPIACFPDHDLRVRRLDDRLQAEPLISRHDDIDVSTAPEPCLARRKGMLTIVDSEDRHVRAASWRRVGRGRRTGRQTRASRYGPGEARRAWAETTPPPPKLASAAECDRWRTRVAHIALL